MYPGSSQLDHTVVSARRKFTGPPNRYKGPQYARLIARLNCERGIKREFPNLLDAKVQGGYEYRVTVPVPNYEARKVRIRFSGRSDVPSVFADGPQGSPHRYPDGSLCMWYPKDPIDRQWVFKDGLLNLIVLTMAHLFREAWWRETGEWAGEEVGHGPDAKERLDE